MVGISVRIICFLFHVWIDFSGYFGDTHIVAFLLCHAFGVAIICFLCSALKTEKRDPTSPVRADRVSGCPENA